MKTLHIYRDDSDIGNPGLAWRVTDGDHVESGPCESTDIKGEMVALAAIEGVTLSRDDVVIVDIVACYVVSFE